ncbi:MAG: sensor histidine kinase [Cellulosilyticaceae bacterium]
MLNKLKKKLILLCILITTLILTTVTLVSFIFTKRELKNRSMLTLKNSVFMVTEHLQTHNYIDHTWLAQFEVSNHIIISITNKNRPLLFSGAYETLTDRQTLVSTARDMALSKYHFNAFLQDFSVYEPRFVSFPLYTASEHFLVSVASIHIVNQPYELIILKDMKQDDTEIIHLGIIFLLLVLLGIILLAIFSWWFAGNAIKPIQISRQEQIDFVSAASHELRSPVAVIQSNVEELLADQSILSTRPFLLTIHHECGHLARLINDLLFLARADSGRWSIHKDYAELDTILLDIYDRFLPLVENNQQKLELLLPDYIVPSIAIDHERIEQVLIILINNAMSYTPPHTQITLQLEVSSNALEIHVIDNGPGVETSKKQHIFKRFYRLDTSRQSDTHYGLGLSIAYEIIKLHGGKLLLIDNPNGGCNFTIRFFIN